MEIRASDAERDRTIDVLREHCGEGRITLEEFAERLDVVLRAKTRADLDRMLKDLPGAAPEALPRKRAALRKRFVAILGNTKTTRRWRVPEQTDALAVLGDCKLDLREAVFDGDEIVLTAVAVLGEVKVIVPRGMAVEVTGVSILGETTCRVDERDVLAALPTVRLRAYSVLGGVKVTTA